MSARTEECDGVLEALLDYAEDPAGRADVSDQTLTHLASCPNCREDVGFLGAALSVEGEDTLTCDDCQAELPALVQARILGEDYPRAELLIHHLSLCPHCAGQYAELLSFTEPIYTGELTEPAHYPAPDLSFLSQKPFAARIDSLGQLIIEFYEGFLQTLTPPAPQPAPAVRERGTKIGSLTVEEESEGVEVEVTVYEQPDKPAHCRVVAEVRIAEREWPDLAGSQVMIRLPDDPPRRRETDAFGKAYFEDIPLDSLEQVTFEILPSVPT